ncbi:MAG: hypothetical protein FWF41_04650 [Betaproteobacteria bacterium]|nr:hypothetical protein [Betaproteobacteria bacterium]
MPVADPAVALLLPFPLLFSWVFAPQQTSPPFEHKLFCIFPPNTGQLAAICSKLTLFFPIVGAGESVLPRLSFCSTFSYTRFFINILLAVTRRSYHDMIFTLFPVASFRLKH